MSSPVRRSIGKAGRAALRRAGFRLVRRGMPARTGLPPDYDAFTRDIVHRTKPYTLTTHERIAALVESVRYVTEAAIPGAIVECGVWRGGSMLTVAETLLAAGDTSRDLWLYDTFWLDMPPPGEHDGDIFGNSAEALLEEVRDDAAYRNSNAEAVRSLLTGAGYPDDRIHIVEGLVEDTIPDAAPEEIALCRLDTDFYESTAHELEHLLPRVAERGVLLIDDYGHFVGARRAVDEYLDSIGGGVLLQRIDFSGRLLVVTEELGRRIRSRAEVR